MNQRPWVELEILIAKDAWPTKAGFAKAVGLKSQGHLTDLLSGRRNPTPAFIAKVAEVLNVPKSMLEKRAAGNERGAA